MRLDKEKFEKMTTDNNIINPFENSTFNYFLINMSEKTASSTAIWLFVFNWLSAIAVALAMVKFGLVWWTWTFLVVVYVFGVLRGRVETYLSIRKDSVFRALQQRSEEEMKRIALECRTNKPVDNPFEAK